MKFDADSLLYLLSHFECNNHTVHMLTQQHLPPPLTSTVKSSLFMHTYFRPLSLAARLHWCHANYSSYINNGWNFSGPTSCLQVVLKYLLVDIRKQSVKKHHRLWYRRDYSGILISHLIQEPIRIILSRWLPNLFTCLVTKRKEAEEVKKWVRPGSNPSHPVAGDITVYSN